MYLTDLLSLLVLIQSAGVSVAWFPALACRFPAPGH